MAKPNKPSQNGNENSNPKSHVTRDLKSTKPNRDAEKETRSHEIEELRKLLNRAEHYPVETIISVGDSMAKAEKGYHWQLWSTASVAVRAALSLKSSVGDWADFVELPFWKGEKQKPRGSKPDGNELRWVLNVAYQARTELQKKRVYEYRKVLEPLVGKMDPAAIPLFLEENGGFEGLKAADDQGPEKARRVNLDDDYNNDDDSNDDSNDDNDNDDGEDQNNNDDANDDDSNDDSNNNDNDDAEDPNNNDDNYVDNNNDDSDNDGEVISSDPRKGPRELGKRVGSHDDDVKKEQKVAKRGNLCLEAYDDLLLQALGLKPGEQAWLQIERLASDTKWVRLKALYLTKDLPLD